jgi:AraC-like DNA-binding protein
MARLRSPDHGGINFRTSDLDMAHHYVTEAFSDHSLDVRDHRSLQFELNVVPSPRLVIGRMGFGADVRIDGPPIEFAYHFNVPEEGVSTVTQGGRKRTFRGRRGWRDVHAARASDQQRTRVRRSKIDEAIEYVDRHVDAYLTAPDLAAAVGVSQRCLQSGFQDRLGISPTAYIRSVRLDRAHLELTAGAGTVTRVAARWGFFHPGRFAQLYKERFGARPSAVAAGQ